MKTLEIDRKTEMRTKYSIGENGAITGLTSCPHCKSTGGYFRKTRISGETEYRYNYDGSEAVNEHIHEGLDYVEQKTLFCIDCKKKIGSAR